MSIGREHPIWPPLEPGDPRPTPPVEAPQWDTSQAWILIVMIVLAGGMTGWVGVDALLHAHWRDGVMMLGISATILGALPFAWRSRRGQVDLLTGKDPAIETAESRAMLETLERYDRVIAGAQAGAAGKGELR